uniref:C2H2-type domain-containing protein n=1 Tax=Tetranychus urticae TaxID=32264 RepID=T1L5N7_TETUR
MQDEEEEENLVITNNNNNNNDKRGTDVTKGKSKSDASAQQQPCKQVKKSEKVKRTADQITSRLFPTTSANSYSPSSSQTSSCTTLSAAATPTVSIQNLKEVKNPQVNNSNNSLVHPHQQHHYHSRTSSEETRESSSSTWETSNFVCDKEVEKISERMNRGNVIPAEFGNGNGHETITSTSVHYNNSGLPGLPATSMNQHYHSSSHLSHPHLLQQQRSQYGYDQVKMNRHSVPNLNGPGRGYDQQQYSVSSEQISGLLINSMSSLDDFLTELEKNLNDFEHGHKTVLANISNTHSNSNVLEEEEETVAPKKSLVQCNLCDKAFPDGPSIRSHISWHGRKGRKSKSRGFRSNQT